VKRATKPKRSQKVPIPIVDAVVEVVFARLAEAAARAKKGTKSSARAKPAAHPESEGLAGAVADLLLASLSREASKTKSPTGARTRKRRTRAR
jgi:hypothetical protein